MSLEKGERVMIVGGEVVRDYDHPMEGEILALDGEELLVNLLGKGVRYIVHPSDVEPIGEEEHEAYGVTTRRVNPQHVPRDRDRVQLTRQVPPPTREVDAGEDHPAYVIEPYWEPRDPEQILVEMPTNRGRRGQWYYTTDLNQPPKDEDDDAEEYYDE